MHILITGGAGFIGSHIAEYHLKRGDKVYVVDNLNTGSLDNINLFTKDSNFQFEIADILTWENLSEATLWADKIYHMAAGVGMFYVLQNPVEMLATNIAGCERVLRAVANNKWRPRMIVASSSSVYGLDTPPHKEDDFLIIKSAAHSHWGYAISKLANESFCQAYAQKREVNVTIARLFNNIGPRQTGSYGMVLPRFVQQAVKGDPIIVYGDGKQTRSFCDVRDTVQMLDLLINNAKAINEVVNVGSNGEICINDLALLVKEISGSDSPIQYVSYDEAYGEAIDIVQHRAPCLKKLHSLITYKNQWSLEDTIRDLVKIQRDGL